VQLALVVMNIAYSLTACPIAHLSDRIGRLELRTLGLIVMIGSDVLFALADGPWMAFAGAALWGFHLGLSQGLISALIADAIAPNIRGTAFGVFGLISGVALLAACLLKGWL